MRAGESIEMINIHNSNFDLILIIKTVTTKYCYKQLGKKWEKPNYSIGKSLGFV